MDERHDQISACVSDQFPGWATGFLMVHDEQGRFLGQIWVSRDGEFVITRATVTPSFSAAR